MTKEIKFSSPIFDLIDQPTPSVLKIPKSYKKMSPFFSSDKYDSVTIKKCIPFLDALTIGYIITTPIDYFIKISEEKEEIKFDLKYDENVPDVFRHAIGISNHDNKQVPEGVRNQYRTVDAIMKWINAWTIKTPPGYSCVFTNPFNRNLPFRIIDGVVDTDQYNLPIHFPFYWTQDYSIKETLLPKGTPLALVIPFKREDWKMKIEKGSIDNVLKNQLKLSHYIIDKYKRLFWRKKSFK